MIRTNLADDITRESTVSIVGNIKQSLVFSFVLFFNNSVPSNSDKFMLVLISAVAWFIISHIYIILIAIRTDGDDWWSVNNKTIINIVRGLKQSADTMIGSSVGNYISSTILGISSGPAGMFASLIVIELIEVASKLVQVE